MGYLSSTARTSARRTTPDDDGDGDGVPFRARANHVHRTWAGTFSSLPELYIQPQSVAEVEKAVVLARRRRRRIVTVGCGHSPSSITCSSSWMLNLDQLAAVIDVNASEQLVVAQAGIRLHALSEELHCHGLALPNLGSIDQQSLAGALATGTHGSSLFHGLLSEAVVALRITLADGVTRRCSPAEGEDVDLFRAALLSLGALGIVVEITLRVVPAFTLAWRQTIDADRVLLGAWSRGLWTQGEFVRAWWFPYTRRAVVWRADKTPGAATAMEADGLEKKHTQPMCCNPPVSYYDRSSLGYHVYHNLLLLAQLVPRVLPWVEWFVFGMQYGFANGTSTAAIQPGRDALLMNCLYSQFVNEWAIPLHRGPEALRRLGAWLNRLLPDHPDYVAHRIPFSAEGLYVHAPVEVRVSDTSASAPASVSPSGAVAVCAGGARPWLDPTVDDGPTLFLNATLYRPYRLDPPCRARYYEAFEWLMRDLGGRPHWAKNFTVRHHELEAMYGNRLVQFRRVRHRADPDGMFVGPWHRECILPDGPKLELEEIETAREPESGGGLHISGHI